MQIFRGVCFRFDCRPQMEPPNTILLEDPAQATFIRRDTFSRNTVFLEYPAQATFFPQDRIFPQDTFPPAGSMAELCKLLLSIDFYLCTVSFRESSTAQPPPPPLPERTQVVFRMTATLVKFGFVMLVVMVGFAMSLHVLFRDLDSSGATFGEAMLGLFKAMLGDTDLFEEFSGGRHDDVATILLVAYLLIMTIMLLNLLVAILSTAHAEVQENVGSELKVSKARIIGYYRVVVKEDLLPAPFNLLPLVASTVMAVLGFLFASLRCRRSRVSDPAREEEPAPGAPAPAQDQRGEKIRPKQDAGSSSTWRKAYARASRAFGPAVFSLVLGSVAVGAGALLWITSALPVFPYAQYAWFTKYMDMGRKQKSDVRLSRCSVASRWALISLWCIVGAPLSLVWLWLKTSTRVVFETLLFPFRHENVGHRITDGVEEGAPPETTTTRLAVESMLKKGPGGVGADKLREFLDDPMHDKDVRQDEKERATTVEHVKLLRNRLEKSRKDDLKQLQDDVKELKGDMKVVLRVVREL